MKQRIDNLNRNRYDIIACILTVAKQNSKKTRLMYHSNLSYRIFCGYFNFLLNNQFLKENNGGYKITEKGFSYLEAYNQLYSILVTD